MTFTELLQKFRAAAEAGDGAAFAALFTEDGVYHDGFYGAFTGRAAIADMIESYFHRAGRDFLWDLRDPVSDGETAYVSYIFSYSSTLAGAEGRRVVFDGMSRLALSDDGLIKSYHEVFDQGAALSQLGFAPERLHKRATRTAEALRADPETAARHLTRL